MDYSNVRLTFDIHEVRSSVVVRLKKGSNTIRLCISLTEDGKVYKLPKACEVSLKVKLPNGERGLCKCDVENKIITCVIDGGITNFVGMSECEIYVVTGDEQVVYGPTFNIMVHDTLVDDDAPELEGDLDALSKMIAENVLFKSEVESKVTEVESRANAVESAFDITERVNLLNPDEVEEVDAMWGVYKSGYIPVTPGDTLTVQGLYEGDTARLTVEINKAEYYNGNMELVREDNETARQITIPDNAAYVKLTYAALSSDGYLATEIAVVKGTAIVPYAPYVVQTHKLKPECLPEGYVPEGGTGTPGEDGATFTPSVSEEGVLSWTNDKGLENPPPVNVQGEKGEKGDPGEKGEKGDPGDGADIVVDDKLDYNSTNPVQNKVLFTAIDSVHSIAMNASSTAQRALNTVNEAKNAADYALNTANNIGDALSAAINRVTTLESDVKNLQENGGGGVDITDDGNGNVTITNSPKFEDIQVALDSIISIQESLIGGGSV